jgi:P-type conjugative transfer protein TrbL
MNTNPSNIFTAYINLGQHYAAIIHPYAIDLLGSLILLEIITIALTYIMGDSDNPPAVGWSIVRLVFCGGFAYWWQIQSWTLAVIVVGSFNQLGQVLTGLADLTPMHFLQTGLSIMKMIWSAPASARLIPDLGAAIEQIVLCFSILVIFLLIAALVTVTLAAFYLIVGPGSILVSFMPSRFTSAMAENYFTWLVRIGVIVMMFYVVLGTAQTFAGQYLTTVTNACKPILAGGPLATLGLAPVDVGMTACSNPLPTEQLVQILADMVILAGICCGIPFVAGALVSHGVNMTLEHIASAKYLAGSTVRTLSHTVGGLSHAVSRLAQHLSQHTTLNQRMEAGAAAAARTSPTTPLTPPPSPPPATGGWNGKPSGPPIAPPPSGPNNSGPGGAPAGLTYQPQPGRPGPQTRAEAVDITNLQGGNNRRG